ncbi:linear amide C-N hydrolase, partial [Collinsella aerofaciens]
MKPRNIAIACGVAGVAVGLAAATGIVYRKQIKSAASLKRLTGYADGYDLYGIDIAYDYDLDRIIAADVRDDQAYIDAVVAQVLPGVPARVQAPQFACSAFVAVDAEGRVRTGRNYDFKDDTSALLVRNHPRGGYASIGFAALNNLGDNTPLDSVAGRAAALMGPFAQLDGVNECGVSIAVLTLDSKPCDQDTQRPVINTSLAIRLVLDRAATTQEAADLLSAYDMHAMAGRDYHFFINDAAGDARVVEWDPHD